MKRDKVILYGMVLGYTRDYTVIVLSRKRVDGRVDKAWLEFMVTQPTMIKEL